MIPMHQKISYRRQLGYPNSMIAEEFGITVSRVMKIVQSYNLPRHKPSRAIPEEPLRKLIADGYDTHEIATKLAKSQKAIKAALKRHRLAVKQKREPKMIYRRRADVLSPPVWDELDDDLFKTVATAFADTGSGYVAITSFAEKHNLTIDAVQARWHKIAVRA